MYFKTTTWTLLHSVSCVRELFLLCYDVKNGFVVQCFRERIIFSPLIIIVDYCKLNDACWYYKGVQYPHNDRQKPELLDSVISAKQKGISVSLWPLQLWWSEIFFVLSVKLPILQSLLNIIVYTPHKSDNIMLLLLLLLLMMIIIIIIIIIKLLFLLFFQY